MVLLFLIDFVVVELSHFGPGYFVVDLVDIQAMVAMELVAAAVLDNRKDMDSLLSDVVFLFCSSAVFFSLSGWLILVTPFFLSAILSEQNYRLWLALPQ